MRLNIKRLRKKTALLIAIAVWTTFYLYQCTIVHPGFFSSANNGDLLKLQIPNMPGKFKPWRSSYGGLFAKRLCMVADLSVEDYSRYCAIVAADADEKLIIGKDVQIMTIEAYNREFGENERELTDEEMKKLMMEKDFVDLRKDWWDVDRITSGTLFRKKLPDACGYKIIFDDQRHRVFIEWHYS